MDAVGGLLLERLRGQREQMVAFLEDLTLAESPSTEPASQQSVRVQLSGAFQELGYRTIDVRGTNSGGQFYARPGARSRITRETMTSRSRKLPTTVA